MNAIIITGAAGGIGQEVARRLARDHGSNARLALVGRTEERVQALADELREAGANVLQVGSDLAAATGPGEAVKAAAAHFGGISGVVSVAGIMGSARLTDVSVEDFDLAFAVNARATFLLGKAAFPHLAESSGSLVAIGSMAGNDAAPFGAYSATKAALQMIVELFAREWGQAGVRANVISPGMIMTPMSPAAHNEELRLRREGRIPLGRMGAPDDIAGVVSFLLSQDARYVTGANIAVDGGVRGNYVSGVVGVS
ncbi:SDR family NAD(P)-dependent oxidoreductase [Homoserinimonas sp. A447]